MNLILVRHGTAEHGAGGDAHRVLTVGGRDEVRKTAEAIARAEPVPDLIVSSPLVRAVQTAELIAAVVGYRGAVTIDRALEPEAPADGVVRLAARLSHRDTVVFAAHEPILSSVCGQLLQERCPPLARGEVVVLALVFGGPDNGLATRATLRWRVAPA